MTQKASISPRLVPPVWFLIAMLLQFALHRFFPMVQLWQAPVTYIGAALMLLGLLLIAWGAGLFKLAGTPLVPFTESTALVTSGPFRFSRNPMYLGMLVMLTGIAIILGSATPFLALPLFFGLIRDLFVIPEEVIMRERFGQAYDDYCHRVRRWL